MYFIIDIHGIIQCALMRGTCGALLWQMHNLWWDAVCHRGGGSLPASTVFGHNFKPKVSCKI
jgi:hypothetical protein